VRACSVCGVAHFDFEVGLELGAAHVEEGLLGGGAVALLQLLPPLHELGLGRVPLLALGRVLPLAPRLDLVPQLPHRQPLVRTVPTSSLS
jgi:hypothetical protein